MTALWRWFRRVVLGQYLEPTQHERRMAVVGRAGITYINRRSV